MEVTIHIGTHKTATTSIQRFAADNDQMLREHGLLFPRSGRASTSQGHHNLAWELRKGPRFTAEAGTVSDLIDELDRESSSAVLISSEDFEYLSRSPAAMQSFNRRLVDAGASLRYLAVLRDLEDYADALFVELTAHGLDLTRSEFMRQVTSSGSFTMNDDWYFEFDHSRFVDDWSRITGGRLETISFEEAKRGRGVLATFFATIGAADEIIGASESAPIYNARI